MSRPVESLFPDEIPAPEPVHATGILPSQRLEGLIEQGVLRADPPIEAGQIQPASLDLRLGALAYRVRASFLPAGSTVESRIEALKAHEDAHEIDLSRPAILEHERVYIVPLIEELRLPKDLSARANPKSTTGRLDVFTRLITDHGEEFDSVPAGYQGRLYLEVVPRTFSIRVAAGTKLNQLRFLRGSPTSSDRKLEQLDKRETLVYLDGAPKKAAVAGGLKLSVDLVGDDPAGIVGYRASRRQARVIDLDKIGYYDPADFWEPIPRPADGEMVLDPDYFYILASRERIRVPPDYAAEMMAYDAAVGEFRVHYAGFFDPGFGYGRNDIKGTRAVLEVRSHGVPFVLRHEQVVGRIGFERLVEPPARIYGEGIGSSYQGQGLALSKQFRREASNA